MTESEPWSYHADGSPVYSLADIIRKRAAATPDAIALAEAGRLTSFAALDRRSSQVARALLVHPRHLPYEVVAVIADST